MTSDRKPGYQTKVSPVPLNRMATDYEKRGFTASHLAAALEARKPAEQTSPVQQQPSQDADKPGRSK